MTSWDAWYQLCIDYKNEFGHLCLQKDEKYKVFGEVLDKFYAGKRDKKTIEILQES